MKASLLSEYLSGQGAELFISDGKLQVRAHRGKLSDDVLKAIGAKQKALMRLLVAGMKSQPQEAVASVTTEVILQGLKSQGFVRLWSQAWDDWMIWLSDAQALPVFKEKLERCYPDLLCLSINPDTVAITKMKELFEVGLLIEKLSAKNITTPQNAQGK